MIRSLMGKSMNSSVDFSPLTNGQGRIEGRLAFLEAETMRARRTALLSMELRGFELATSQRPGKRILIAGWYGADNLGDELMLRAVLEHLPEEALSRTGVLLWDNSTYDRLSLDARVHPIHYPAATRELDALVDHFDVVVWGGGAILDDNQFNDDVNNFNTGNLFIRINELMIGHGKEVYCLGLSANESLSDTRYLSKLKHVIENAEHFSIRDDRSVELLISLGMPQDKITSCEDLVFSMACVPTIHNEPKEDCLTVGFVLFHAGDLLETYAEVIQGSIKAAEAFAEHKRVKALLIPFLNEGHFDEHMNSELSGALEEKMSGVKIELANYEIDVTRSPIRNCDVLISYKYHSALIASCAGIPCLMVSRSENPHYANKMSHLAELAGEPSRCISSSIFESSAGDCVRKLLEQSNTVTIGEDIYTTMSAYMDSICKRLAS